jgi:general secretion pathway protein F
MTVFEYKALNASGKILEGTIEASTPADVLVQLDRAGITPL